MQKKEKLIGLGIWLVSTAIFLFFQSKSVFGGDGGDLVAAVCVKGVAHPPGYPLYTLLGTVVDSLPLYTPAWRVSLLSSIPAGLVVALVYYFTYVLTKSLLTGIFSAFTLAFSYLFWLYAEIPEAFSLNNLFLLVLIILTYFLITKISLKKLYLFAFVCGLSGSHHHFSFWFYPVFFFFIFWYNRNFWKKIPFFTYGKLFFLLLAGFLPYAYIFISAKSNPVINWNAVSDFASFWRLFTRQGYGTFLSNNGALSVGVNVRLFLVYANFLFFNSYFGWLGLVLFGLGFLFLYQKNKRVFFLFLALYLWELFFLFYSGFRISSSMDVFMAGVVQRFILPAVLLEVLLMGFGAFFLVNKVSAVLVSSFKFKFFSLQSLKTLFFAILLLYPASLFFKNYLKIYSLKDDFTAENLARDILNTVPQNAMLFLSSDTTLFNTQYVRYCLNERTDVNLIHLSLLTKDYLPTLKKNYSMLVLPDKASGQFKEDLISLNYTSHPIYVSDLGAIQSGYFVPYGLLYQYLSTPDEVPDSEAIYQANQKIWQGYQNFSHSVLAWFEPVTLGDVRRNYYTATAKLGKLFISAQKPNQAAEYLEKAIAYEPKDIQARVDLAQIYTKAQDCQKAEDLLLKVAELSTLSADPYKLLLDNAQQCWKDKTKIERFEKLYSERKKVDDQNFGGW